MRHCLGDDNRADHIVAFQIYLSH